MSDLSRIQSFFTDNFINILFALLNILFFSGILLVNSKAVFFIFMAFSLLTFGYNYYFSQKKKSYDYANFSLHAEKDNVTYELMMGMPGSETKQCPASWNECLEKAGGERAMPYN